MKAFEVMATLNDQKQLLLDDSLDIDTPSRVKCLCKNNYSFTKKRAILKVEQVKRKQ